MEHIAVSPLLAFAPHAVGAVTLDATRPPGHLHEDVPSPDGLLGLLLVRRIVDHVPFGVAVVGSEGRLLLVNQAARRDCTRHPLLHIEQGRLIAPQLRHHAELGRAIAAARRGRWSLIQLRQDADRLTLAIMPLWPGAAGGDEDPVLVMFGLDSPCQDLAIELYARSHGLTPAESRLLQGLREGLSPREMARRHDVALSTVRSQIGSVRVKTGVRSIMELVRTLSCLPPIMPAALCT